MPLILITASMNGQPTTQARVATGIGSVNMRAPVRSVSTVYPPWLGAQVSRGGRLAASHGVVRGVLLLDYMVRR